MHACGRVDKGERGEAVTIPYILVVTGSRALCATAAAESWARGEICDALCDLAMRGLATVVVTGDAPGPDVWAIHEAASCALRWIRYGLDGWRTEGEGFVKREPVAWCTAEEVPKRGTRAYSRWPLTRNRVMVAAVKRAVAAGEYTASALALAAPWARTHGTQHTIGLLTRAKIAAATHVCPAEYGPQQMRA